MKLGLRILFYALCFLLGTLQAKAASYQGSDCADGSVVLGFTGDILVHDALYKSILPSQNFVSLWKKTIPLFNKADYMVVNLEGPAALGIDKSQRDVGDVGFTYDLNVYSGTKFVFNFHSQILLDLKNSGVDLIGNANNHSLDRGPIGIDKTLEMARKIQIPVVGVRESFNPNFERFHITDVKGYRLAFIACTEMVNSGVDPKRQVLFCYKDFNEIESMIKRLSARSDIDGVIVLPHWGAEYSQTPDKRQTSFAKKYLDAGAIAVIGSHPHVLQPTEKYVTQDGRTTLIAYSLGNFLAFQSGLEKKTGAVVYLRLGRNAFGKTQLLSSYYTPTYRDGYEVFPISSRGAKDVLKEAAKHLINETRIEPDQLVCLRKSL